MGTAHAMHRAATHLLLPYQPMHRATTHALNLEAARIVRGACRGLTRDGKVCKQTGVGNGRKEFSEHVACGAHVCTRGRRGRATHACMHNTPSSSSSVVRASDRASLMGLAFNVKCIRHFHTFTIDIVIFEISERAWCVE